MPASRRLLETLCQQIGPIRPDSGRFSSGSRLDELLPDQGVRRGMLVELLGGGSTLALILARQALRPEGSLVVVDPERRFYPPAAARLGIDLERLLVVQPPQPDWFVHQALSCPAVDSVLCWPRHQADLALRRWQLAAEQGGSVGLLVRPRAARGSPSWAGLRLLVEPRAANRWRIEVAGGPALERGAMEISIDDQGQIHDCLPVVSELADSAPPPRAAQS